MTAYDDAIEDYMPEELGTIEEVPPHPLSATRKLSDSEDEDDTGDAPGNSVTIPLLILAAVTLSAVVLMLIVMLQSSPVVESEDPVGPEPDERDELIKHQEFVISQLLHNHEAKESDMTKHVDLLRGELDNKTQALHQCELARQEEWANHKLFSSEHTGHERLVTVDVSNYMRYQAFKVFGNAPHYVEFTVEMDGDTNYFTVELAPTELLPASMYIFLTQVNENFWNDASFYINAPHMLVARPVSADEHTNRLAAMEKLGVAHVPIVEYSEEFPHAPYTLGFADDKRPGPEFYINRLDNDSLHQGQPCFAKVIIGTATIDLLGERESPDETYFIKPVTIRSTRILDQIEDAVGGTAYARIMQKLTAGEEQ